MVLGPNRYAVNFLITEQTDVAMIRAAVRVILGPTFGRMRESMEQQGYTNPDISIKLLLEYKGEKLVVT